MDQVEQYLNEISAAMCKMSPIERERMMEVLRISFPEFFDSNHKRS